MAGAIFSGNYTWNWLHVNSLITPHNYKYWGWRWIEGNLCFEMDDMGLHMGFWEFSGQLCLRIGFEYWSMYLLVFLSFEWLVVLDVRIRSRTPRNQLHKWKLLCIQQLFLWGWGCCWCWEVFSSSWERAGGTWPGRLCKDHFISAPGKWD